MNILVTGAGRGIGYATVYEFASRGNHNIIALSRNKSRLSELVSLCNENFPSSKVLPFALDLESGPAEFETLQKFIIQSFTHLDILLNNAGYLVNKPFGSLDTIDEQKMWTINYLGPAKLIRLLIPIIGISRRGHIVNVSSMGGVQGSVKFSGLSSYSASKSALATLTECLAEEYKDSNFAVNCLALGAVQTEMLQEAFPSYKVDMSAKEIAVYLVDFCLKGMFYCNGRILQYSFTRP